MRHSGRWTPKRAALAFGAACVAAIAVSGAVLAAKWPFGRAAVIARISKDTGADVAIDRLRTTYFPPGFDAENIRLNQRGTGVAILSIRRVRIRATYTGIIRKKVSEIDVEGFQLATGHGHSFGSRSSSGGSFGVAKLVAEDGSLEIFSSDGGHQPFRVSIRSLVLTGIGSSQLGFRVAARATRPPADFQAEGRLGQFRSNSVKSTPISGRYTVSNADLSVLGGVSGLLSSSGKIGGSLGRIEWEGTALVPDFEVAGTSHKGPLRSDYTIFVDTGDGKTEIQKVRTSFRRSTVLAHGQVSQAASAHGKTLGLALRMEQGRVDDLLWLVSGQPRPGMTGDIRFDASLELPPAPPKFLRRLMLRGNVEITRALFTNPKLQLPLNYLSESAKGMNKREQRADTQQIPGVIRGAVDDSDAVARLTNVHYSAPGVNASLDGEFNLIHKGINFKGVLATEGKLGDGAIGLKSVLLKIARPFLAIHRKGKITTMAFTIRGSSGHPVLTVSGSKAAHAAAHLSNR